MVTSQGQVLTQALPPGTIHIQNSQVTLPGQTPASPATPHRGLIAAALCIPHKPSRPHFSLSASEWARLTAGGTSLFIHVTLPGLIPVRDQCFVFCFFLSGSNFYDATRNIIIRSGFFYTATCFEPSGHDRSQMFLCLFMKRFKSAAPVPHGLPKFGAFFLTRC